MFQSQNKGQAEFNWILILIAGFIILSSFIAFAIDYKNLSDRRINTELSLALSSQLDSLTSAGLTTIVDPQGLTFFSTRLSCKSVILNTGEPISIEDKVIFSAGEIQSDKLLLWVDEFSLPYRISNIYYISSPYTKYYVLYDDSTQQLANSILSYIPTTQDRKRFFNFELISEINPDAIQDDIQKESIREVRIVTFNDIDMPSLSVKTKIIRLTKNLNAGDVYYQDTNELAKYIKKQLLLAAIFSDNYKCNADKLLARLNNINIIYQDKAARLFFKTQTKQQCNYQLFISAILSTDTSNFDNLPGLEQRLSTHNLELNKRGCADVF